MPWGAAIAAVGSIGGALIASDSAEDATNKQVDAQKDAAKVKAAADEKALVLQQEQLAQARKDSEPYRNITEQALYNYADDLGVGGVRPDGYVKSQGFEATPEYQNAIQSGEKAIGRMSPVYASGQRLKGLLDYNQKTAQQFRNDRLTRLQNLIGIGTGTVGNLTALGANFAGNAGNLLSNGGTNAANSINAAGNAEATGILGQGKIGSDVLKSGGDILSGYLKNRKTGTDIPDTSAYSSSPTTGLQSPAWQEVSAPAVDTSAFSTGSTGTGLGSDAWQSLF